MKGKASVVKFGVKSLKVLTGAKPARWQFFCCVLMWTKCPNKDRHITPTSCPRKTSFSLVVFVIVVNKVFFFVFFIKCAVFILGIDGCVLYH